MFLKLDARGPLYDQIYRSLRANILDGRLAPGARAPATRELARDLQVSRNVAMMAYQQLLAEGYLTTRRGAGTFVAGELPQNLTMVGRQRATRMVQDLPAPRLSAYARRMREDSEVAPFRWEPRRASLPFDFRYGRPAFADFPHDTWCRILARRARSATIRDLDYAPAEGLPALRRIIAEYVGRARAINCSPDQVLVLSGSQQAFDLTARLLIDPGDTVILEEPHYRAARVVMKAAGARIETVAVDEHGLPAAALARRTTPRLVIVTPSHQFPTGAVMPLGQRLELIAWANRTGAFIFEDDYDSEYRYQGRPMEAMRALDERGCVLYAATFSKLMFPSLRLGYMVLPEQMIEPFRSAKALIDTGSPTLPQLALVDFIREGHFERHLHRLRARNASRRAAMLSAIGRCFGDRARVSGINAGIHLLMWLPEFSFRETREILLKAERAGVGVYSVGPFYLTPPAHAGLLLGYSSLPEKQITEGIRRLAAALTSRK
jgi:GntR family transcriptional regulator/MocR family aminotransferase